MKKLTSVFLTGLLCLSLFFPVAASAQPTQVITFEEYYTAMQDIYAEYGMSLEIENPNLDFIYTTDYLEADIERFISSIEAGNYQIVFEVAEPEENAMESSIRPYAMPVNYTWSANTTIRKWFWTNGYDNYAKFRITVTGVVDVQTGNVTTASGSYRHTSDLNMDSENLTVSCTRSGSTVKVTVSGSVTFGHYDPETGNYRRESVYGPFDTFSFVAENYI